MERMAESVEELRTRLAHPNPSARLQAALAAGISPDPESVEVLVERSGIEPDFFVRDMLTWALTRLPADRAVPRLVDELSSPFPQARSQSLHTLSKIGDRSAAPAVTAALLHDEEDEVAKAAWRAAVALTGPEEQPALAAALASELGRRDAETRRSLTRALLALGEGARAELERVAAGGTFGARVHAVTTLLHLDEPERGFTSAFSEARRIVLAADDAAAAD